MNINLNQTGYVGFGIQSPVYLAVLVAVIKGFILLKAFNT